MYPIIEPSYVLKGGLVPLSFKDGGAFGFIHNSWALVRRQSRWRKNGERGAVQLPVHHHSPPFLPPDPLSARGPLPSSMPRSCARECGCAPQCRSGRRQASTSPSVPHRRSCYTPHRNFPVPMVHLTITIPYGSVLVTTWNRYHVYQSNPFIFICLLLFQVNRCWSRWKRCSYIDVVRTWIC